MEKKFTGGNWHLTKNNGYLTIESDNGQLILPDWDINSDPSAGININAEIEIANFTLMTAAPKMLEVLEKLIKPFEGMALIDNNNQATYPTDLIEEAFTVIHSAYGK